MAEPKRSQLPSPFHKTGAIKIMKIKPMLARIKSRPVSRYLLRNCNAAIRATVVEPRKDFNAKVDRPLRRAMLIKYAASPPDFSIEQGTARSTFARQMNRPLR